jgi:hypothetical protein
MALGCRGDGIPRTEWSYKKLGRERLYILANRTMPTPD